jgi:N-acyl-D-amino-acid deacylase
VLLAALIALSATARLYAQIEPPADVVLQGGMIYDGSDAEPFRGDVAIRGDRIVYVGPTGGMRAGRVIDATGMIVAPGLIDAHTHPDSYLRSPDATARLNAPWLTQGVSTVVIGVDGYGTPDVKSDVTRLEASKIGTNIVAYVGFGAVRHRVIGDAARAPDAEELARMQSLVAKGMCEGAVGFSTGLFYAPQSFAKTEEVIALAKEAAVRGGIYDTHQRDESDYSIGLMNSVREVLTIGSEAGMPVHIAHLKALGVDVQGEAPRVIALIDDARAHGQNVTADQYP